MDSNNKNNNNNENSFSFSYSAGRQREIDRIVSKYADNKEDKFQLMKKLDDSVESAGTAAAIIYAIVSTLVFGAGMSISLAFHNVPIGAVVGLIGIVMLFFTASLRRFVVKKRRQKIAPKILELAEDISNSPI